MPSIYGLLALGVVPVVLLIVLAAIGALNRKAKEEEEYLKRRATRLAQPVPTVTGLITNVRYGLHE